MSRKRRSGYLNEASQRFLVNLPYRSPLEAVEAGARSLRQWCDCLNDARAAHGLTHDPVEIEDVSFAGIAIPNQQRSGFNHRR